MSRVMGEILRTKTDGQNTLFYWFEYSCITNTHTQKDKEFLLMAYVNMQNYPPSQMFGIFYTHFHIRLNYFDIVFAGGDERAV